jgi:hypothetical protein
VPSLINSGGRSRTPATAPAAASAAAAATAPAAAPSAAAFGCYPVLLPDSSSPSQIPLQPRSQPWRWFLVFRRDDLGWIRSSGGSGVEVLLAHFTWRSGMVLFLGYFRLGYCS